MTPKFFLYTYNFQLNYHLSRPPKSLKISSFSTPWSICLTGLPGVEYIGEAWPKKSPQKKVSLFSGQRLSPIQPPLVKHSIWIYRYPSRMETVRASPRLWHNSTDSLAVCGNYKQSSAQLKKTSKSNSDTGQRSLARVLKIAHDGSKTTEVWKRDSDSKMPFFFV